VNIIKIRIILPEIILVYNLKMNKDEQLKHVLDAYISFSLLEEDEILNNVVSNSLKNIGCKTYEV